ncbi:hypothetical protein LZ32DRAFT_607246 [Colletotrichum eremochloae]|nr:hypothetical protein LZ32DRAFT_607246 [Colletotrichum eremochloae]
MRIWKGTLAGVFRSDNGSGLSFYLILACDLFSERVHIPDFARCAACTKEGWFEVQ